MKFTLVNNNENCDARLTSISKDVYRELIALELDFTSPQSPSPICVEFSYPCNDVYSFWSPALGASRFLRPDWAPACTRSRLASWMPLQQALSLRGENRLTVSVGDAATPITVSMGINEETATVLCRVEFFTSLVAPLTHYSAVIRLDETPLKYYDALKEAVKWWESLGYTPAPVPEHARMPMYSTWYSFHQQIDVEAIVEQCRLAKSYGMETVIVDDGWQTDDNNRGYAYCGDWEVAEKKMGSMKRFVDLVHEQGLKFMLWFSVPYVGKYSKAFDRFRDMLLDSNSSDPNRKWFHLDPRYPEVRRYLVEIYEKAVKEWGLDGLKLDFIDSFALRPHTAVTDPRRDFVSLEEGLEKLLEEITVALRKLRPDILIEFRQSYVGPAIRKYGNMLRAADCPNDAIKNRERITDLRFTSGSTAVHSDMLMWNAEEPVESAAVQVISSLFSVPQISVWLDRIPEQHQKMLRFYLEYWKEHRELLLDGEFFALSPESLYSLAGAKVDGAVIAVDYVGAVWEPEDELHSLDLINCHGREGETLRLGSLGLCRIEILDCMGNQLSVEERVLEAGILDLPVPPAGMLRLRKL